MISSDDEAMPPAPAPLADQVQGQDQGQGHEEQLPLEPPAPANQEPVPPPMFQTQQSRILRRIKAKKSFHRRRKLSAALAKAQMDLANATHTIERAAYMLRDAFMCGCCGTNRADYTIHVHEQSGPHNMCNECIHHFAPRVADLDPDWHYCARCSIVGQWTPTYLPFPSHATAVVSAIDVLEGTDQINLAGQPANNDPNQLTLDAINQLLEADRLAAGIPDDPTGDTTESDVDLVDFGV